MALVYAMVLGADSIDDAGVLRAGRHGPAARGLDLGCVDLGDVLAGVDVRGCAPARRAA
jgi:hypothetical protein